MGRILRFWPAFVVGIIWTLFLAVRIFMSSEPAKDVASAPQFFEYHKPLAEKPRVSAQAHVERRKPVPDIDEEMAPPINCSSISTVKQLTRYMKSGRAGA